MEQLIIELFFVLLRNVFQISFMYFVLTCMLTLKFNKAAFLVIATILSTLVEILSDIPSLSFLRLFAFVGTLYIPALLCFKEKKIICIFAASLETATLLVSDIAVSSISYLAYNKFLASKATEHSWDTLIYVLMTDIILASVMFVLIVLWNKFFHKAHTRSLLLFVLFPISQYVFFAACSYQTWTVSQLSLLDNPFIIAAIVLSLLADIAMLRALTQNSKMQQLKQRLADMQHEMDIQLQYYDGLADKMQEVREYRHDINNLISVTEALLLGSCTDDGRILFEELKEKAAASAMPIYSADPTVNAVLYHKAQAAKEKGISFSVSMARDECFPFERSDICSMLANLLDNALREAEKFSDSFVEVSVSKSMGLLHLNVTNSTDKSIGSERPSSDKPDSEKHGFGLEIVERVADKYNGKFVLSADNGTARAAVVLPLENACR